MTTWWHHPTILTLRFDRRLVLRVSCILLLCIALITTLFFGVVSRATPGVNETIGFQGRLLDSNGDIVPDGYYNMQFKIYEGGSGTAAGNPGGTLKWTETYINNGVSTGAVEVKSGFMSVNLGSVNPFGTQVDWNQDTLWLSMNIAGASTSCTSFNTGSCVADGEMLPMKRLTATPYSLNSAALNGKTAENFIQLAQGVQTDASLNTSSIFINKTGTGNLLQLQVSGNNALSVTHAGDIEFGSGATRALYIGNAGANSNGDALVLHAGYGGDGTGNNGGGLFLQGGGAGGTNAEGGSVAITGGVGTGTGKDGSIYIGASDTDAVQIGSTYLTSGTQAIIIGANDTAGGTTNVTIGSGGSATGGTTTLQAKNAVTIKTDGTTRATFSGTTAYFGNGVTAGTPNNYSIQGTGSTTNSVNGGSLTITGGNATGTNANGGDLTLSGGNGSGTGGNSGAVIVKSNGTDTNNAFQVQNAAGATVLNVNTLTSIVSVGTIKLGSASTGSVTTNSLWDSGTVSGTAYTDSSEPINLGTTFKSDVDGYITGVKFYNPTGGNNLGYDLGKLWACASASCNITDNGTALATVSFPADTSAGWKTASFTTPVHISANTYYVVTHYSSNGSYFGTANYFSSDRDNAPLHAPHTTSETPNGNFTIANGSNFPTTSYNGANYWVDVEFQAETNVDKISSESGLLVASDEAVTLQGTSIRMNASNGGNIQIGSGSNDGNTNLLTLDKAATAPTISDEALLGSMYYDTTLGVLQCYEADGWGACSAQPDNFITLSPEYSNAVMNGSSLGTMSSDICSDTLDINDGSSSQPTICGTNETYNFYNWTSSQATTQTKSIFVTYQLPSSFKEFIAGSTSLMGRTNSADATVTYQAYRKSSSGLTACGSTTSVSTGTQTTWQQGTATGTADPSNPTDCAFEAGDSIVFKINMASKDSANAYASTLNFAFSNN